MTGFTARTYHLDHQKWAKAYRQAAIAFGILLGLNTIVLIGIGLMQLNDPNPMFGPGVMLLGMGAAFAGVTVSVTGSIASRQRWAAIVGLLIVILVAIAGWINYGLEASEQAADAGANPGGPTCGTLIIALVGFTLLRAINTKCPPQVPPTPASPPANPYAQPGSAPSYMPYGQHQEPEPAQTGRGLGTGGLFSLIFGAVLLVGGIGIAVYGFVSETTVDESQWQIVRDPELAVSLEMPGDPVVSNSPDAGDGGYEKTYTVERHQYIVEFTCTRLAPEWYFQEADYVAALETQFEPQYVRSQSTSRVTVNGISMWRVDYQLHDGGVAVVLGFYKGIEAVMVSVVETSAVDRAVSERVLNSLKRAD